MTRAEYFVRHRAALLGLDDRMLGIFVWHCAGQFARQSADVPPPLSLLDLHERLFPAFTPEDAQAPAHGKPLETHRLQHHAEYRSAAVIAALKGQKLARYESDVLALGQCARDIIIGNPTALRNVAEAQRRLLDVEWERLNTWALRQEQSAVLHRQRADAARANLNAVLAEIERLKDL